MELPLESVPNFSEGRDAGTIEALLSSLSAHADVLDVHSDADHNRSVFTLVGDDTSLVEALLAAEDDLGSQVVARMAAIGVTESAVGLLRRALVGGNLAVLAEVLPGAQLSIADRHADRYDHRSTDQVVPQKRDRRREGTARSRPRESRAGRGSGCCV